MTAAYALSDTRVMIGFQIPVVRITAAAARDANADVDAVDDLLEAPQIDPIAETLAWEEASVEKIIRRYVGRKAAIQARIRKLEGRE